MTYGNYCNGHYGQRIGKSVTVTRNGRLLCGECRRPLPPGTQTIIGVA